MYSVIFLGTPQMSADLLEKIINWKKVKVVGVVTQPDNPFKKGNKALSPVAIIADKYNIPCHKPERLNKDYDFIKEKNPDLLLTFAFGQIISSKVLALSKYKALNIHGSLLPKYRGAAPIQYALLNGDKKTGACLMAMEKDVDSGAVYGVEEFDIEEEDNYTSLCKKMTDAAFRLIEDDLLPFFEGKPGKAQDEAHVTFTSMISQEQEHLDLNLSASDLINYIRALSYVPGAYLYLNEEKIKIYRAKKINDLVTFPIGEIVKAKKELIFQAKDGQIAILELQRPGKKMMSAESFLNGYYVYGKRFN